MPVTMTGCTIVEATWQCGKDTAMYVNHVQLCGVQRVQVLLVHMDTIVRHFNYGCVSGLCSCPRVLELARLA